LHKRKPQETLKISRNKCKRQPIGMLGRSSGNHDWLLANASAYVYGLHASLSIAFNTFFELCDPVTMTFDLILIGWG